MTTRETRYFFYSYGDVLSVVDCRELNYGCCWRGSELVLRWADDSAKSGRFLMCCDICRCLMRHKCSTVNFVGITDQHVITTFPEPAAIWVELCCSCRSKHENKSQTKVPNLTSQSHFGSICKIIFFVQVHSILFIAYTYSCIPKFFCLNHIL